MRLLQCHDLFHFGVLYVSHCDRVWIDKCGCYISCYTYQTDECSRFGMVCISNQTHQACFLRSWFMSFNVDRDHVVDLMRVSKQVLVSLIERSAYDDATPQQPHEHQGSVFMFSYFTTAVTVQFWQWKCFPAVLSLEVNATVNVYQFYYHPLSGWLHLWYCISGMCSHSEGWGTSLGSDMFPQLLNCRIGINELACFDCLLRTFCARMGYHGYRHLFLQGFSAMLNYVQ